MKLLKEDIGFTNDVTKTRVRHNLVKGGSRLKMPANRIILRQPTKEEIQAADVNPSDYQIAQLRILSKVLFDFGLVSRVYRSKKSSIVKSNTKQIEKFKQIFRIFLANFNSNEPIKNVRNAFALVSDDIFTAADFVNVLSATKDWDSDELLMNLATIYRNINQYNQDTEPSQADIKVVRKVYNTLSSFIQTEEQAGHSEREIKKAITYANTINNIMNEPDLENAKELVYNDVNVKNVSDLEADINEYLSSQMKEGKSGHSNTILHEEATRNLQELAIKLKNDGYVGGLTTENVFDYLKSNEPTTIEYISNAYDIPVDKLSGENFPTWESVAKFFYSPENIRRIEKDQLAVNQRARATGDIRKGALLAVDAKTVANRKAQLKKQMEKNPGEAIASSLEEKLDAKEKEYAEAKNIRDRIKADLVEAQRSGKGKSIINKLEAQYKQAQELAFKIGKSAAAIRHALKKANQSSKKSEIKKSDIDKLKELEQEEQKIYAKARKNLDGSADLRDFDAEYKQDEEIDDAWDFDSDTEVSYNTWSFVVTTTNQKVVDFIIAQLEKGLHKISKYINISKFEPEYPDLNGTQIVIDYPKECNLAILFNNKPKLAYQMMDTLIALVRREFKLNVSYYDDDKYIKVNQEF